MAKRKKSTFERLRSDQLNRKQRRDLGRRLVSDDPGLSIIHPDAGGIDVGNESHFVAVPPDRDAHPVQEFGCWTADLKRMAEWLRACRIDTVAMQATGVYWIAVRHPGAAWHPSGGSERPVHQERARQEERCAREPVADEVAHLWAAARLVPSGREHGKRADDLATAGPARAGSRASGAAHAKSADKDEHSVGQC